MLNLASVPWLQINSGYRVSGEVEKNSFIALPGKAVYRGLKLCVLP